MYFYSYTASTGTSSYLFLWLFEIEFNLDDVLVLNSLLYICRLQLPMEALCVSLSLFPNKIKKTHLSM